MSTVLQFVRAAATANLFAMANFLATISGYPPLPEKPLKEMADWLEALLLNKTGGQKYGLELVPRECRKTTLLTAAVIYLLAKNPNLRILISAHKHDHSKAILMAIKSLMQHPAFIEVFGDWRQQGNPWRESSIIVGTRTAILKEPSIDTAGVDTPKVGGHYDVILIDDLMNESNANSEPGRERCHRHLYTCYPLLDSDHGVLGITATRWHHLDTYGRIQEMEDKREKDNLPRLWEMYIRGSHVGDELFFPSHLTEEKLDRLRRELPPRWYSCWYENEPIEEGMVFFPKMYRKLCDAQFTLGHYVYPQVHVVERIDGEEVRQSLPAYIMLLHDPAISEDIERGNANGILVVAVTPGKRFYVLEAKRAYGPEKTLQWLELYTRKYHPQVYSFEPINAQKLWGRLYRERVKNAGLQCPRVHEFSGKGVAGQRSKMARIEMLQPKYWAGDLVIGRGLSDLQDEMDKYPQGLKDLLDALAQAMEIAREPDTTITIPGAEENERPRGNVKSSRPEIRLPNAGLGTPVFKGIKEKLWPSKQNRPRPFPGDVTVRQRTPSN